MRPGRSPFLDAFRNLANQSMRTSLGYYQQSCPHFPSIKGRSSSDLIMKGSSMKITRSGVQPSGKGPADWFTGIVRVDPLFSPPDPARVAGALVTFEPGARTAWHTHPLGQTLIVTAGRGWTQSEGGPVQVIRPGDVVWFAPGEKHWHGATAT